MADHAKGAYTQLEAVRQPYLERARDAARITIPTLMSPLDSGPSTEYPTPYQSLGSRGVNNLASALLLSLLPPNAPFFRLVLDDQVIKQIEGMDQAKTEIETSLAEIERAVMKEIESSSLRVSTFELVKQLLVAGNALVYIPDKGGMRVFKMDRYVIKRDPMGNPMTIVIKENLSPSMLPASIAEEIRMDMASHENSVDLYTHVQYGDKKLHVYQEIKGIIIPGSEGSFPLDRSPYLPLRMLKADGEDYGRSYVEQYLGDLKSLEGLTQAIVEGSAAAAKTLFLVNPNGTTRARTLATSANGAIVSGNAADVTTLQLNKFADFRVAFETIGQIKERLSFAFMLTEASIRSAERVTAEEVRLVTAAIERQLGGIYSLLSQEFQLPLVKRLMTRMQKQKRLPKVPKEFVFPTIVTGIDALGRGQDLSRLDAFIQGIGQTMGPEGLATYVNLSEYLDRRAAALGIDTAGLIRTQEEIQAAQQQAAMAQQVQQLGPEVLRSGVEIAKNA